MSTNDLAGTGPELEPKDSQDFLDKWGPEGYMGQFETNWPQITNSVRVLPRGGNRQFVGNEWTNGAGGPEDYLTEASPITVTDTFIDDGLYVPGTASLTVLDPWGDE